MYAVRKLSLSMLVVSVVIGPCTLLAACAPSHASTASITDHLTMVDITRFQSIPVPAGHREVVLNSASQLSAFAAEVTADHISLTRTHSENSGCTGGVSYSAVLSRQGSPSVTLYAYQCGGILTDNMTGNVMPFLSYLRSLLP